ncbi:proteasome assembly chaperone family protein [Candidatus Woesearchaeota archaeon]|nr:proteasome assembly chaperone family protein [Candidatus Woesearchaeota archaeon]
MEVKLFKKPKTPIIIQGFPGFGLVGTITTEFLIEHLKTEYIGYIWLEELPTMVAIHNSKLVQPIGIFHDKRNNIVIFHVITAAQGIEWKITDAILDVAKQLAAKEIICLEGVGSATLTEDQEPKTYFYASNSAANKKLSSNGIEALGEGIIMGATSALLLRSRIPTTALFAETHSNMPDSKAAAKIIKALDVYLGLKVDYGPLLDAAVKFEEKLKTLITKSQEASDMQEKKKLSYVG